MKRIIILAVLLCFAVAFIDIGIANGQDVKKSGESIVNEDSLKWEALKGTLTDSAIKTAVMEKWKKWEEILNELGLTERIEQLVKSAPDTMPEETDIIKWVLNKLTMDDKIQRDLEEYNKKREPKISYDAVIKASGILSRVLEKKQKAITAKSVE